MTEEDFMRERDRLNRLTGHEPDAFLRERQHEELIKLKRQNEKLKEALLGLLSRLSLTIRGKQAKRYYVHDWHIDDFAREVRNAKKLLEGIKK